MDTKTRMMTSAVADTPASNSTSPNSNSANSGSPARPEPKPAAKRILIIDSEPTRRKERVATLKQRGFVVYPALKIEEARSRCRRGGYDLIIVSSAANQEAATQLCGEIKQGNARQQVLLMSPGGAPVGQHDVVSDDPKALADKVEALLSSRATANPVAA